MNRSGWPLISPWVNGQTATNPARPASDSEMVGTVRKFDEPVSTNWPGPGSRSTASLIARTRGSPARWTSSMTSGRVPSARNPAGSATAALTVPWSSRLRSVPLPSWLCTRVVLPAWRGPVTTVTRRAATVSWYRPATARSTSTQLSYRTPSPNHTVRRRPCVASGGAAVSGPPDGTATGRVGGGPAVGGPAGGGSAGGAKLGASDGRL